MSLPRFLLIGAIVCTCWDCITSPPTEFGATAAARREKLGSCPKGLIDDLDDGDSQVVKTEDRDGYWFTFVDTEGSTVSPKGDFKPDAGGPNGSKFAARMHGKIGSTGKSLYAGMGVNLRNPKGAYDASKYKGVSFWAKGPGKVRFEALDVNTSPEGDRCRDCYNHCGVELFLSNDWTHYTVPFDRLAQQPGWGDPDPEVTRNALFAVQWQFKTPNADYDIWVDDVAFVGCP
ncbi:MAG: hypothetical protein M3O46_12860 [Myxococcota bacterium]|nr:hypothetical protein [Myxococcota bacterium]